MPTHDWRCPRCRRTLGKLTTTWGHSTDPPVLTLRRPTRRIARHGEGWIITCDCGGARIATAVDIRFRRLW